MNIENKIKNVIDMLEDAIAFEDWRTVETARKELTFLYEEIDSTSACIWERDILFDTNNDVEPDGELDDAKLDALEHSI
jgi:hypothetical protein